MSKTKQLVYKTLAYSYYYLGDFVCDFRWDWCFQLYQYAMKKSMEYDELAGWQIWKEPINKHEDL